MNPEVRHMHGGTEAEPLHTGVNQQMFGSLSETTPRNCEFKAFPQWGRYQGHGRAR